MVVHFIWPYPTKVTWEPVHRHRHPVPIPSEFCPSIDGPEGTAVLGPQPSSQPSLQSPSCLNKKNRNPSLPPGDAWELEGIRLLTAKIEASFALEKMTVRRAASRGGWGGWGALPGPGHLEVGCS